jgi:hypothetical protein
MVGFGKRLDGPGGRRTAARRPSFTSTGIMTVDRSEVGYLLDVSATGAKLDGGGGLSIGQAIWLRTGNIDVLAQVVWSGPGTCGIKFDTPLSEDEMNELSQIPQGALFASLTTEEKLGAADWMNGMIR